MTLLISKYSCKFWVFRYWMPELALAHNHTDEYFACHHRTFIWRRMEIETETHIGALDWAPKVQMKSRRRENIKTEVRTARGAFTHWYKGTDLMKAHQGQLDWDWTSMRSNRILWMWLTRGLTEKPLTMALGLVSSAWTGFLGSWSVWMLWMCFIF